MGTISAFPLHKRQKLVHAIGSVLASKHGEEANRFWRETAKGLISQLMSDGVSLESAQVEIRSLLHAVLKQQHAQAAQAL